MSKLWKKQPAKLICRLGRHGRYRADYDSCTEPQTRSCLSTLVKNRLAPRPGSPFLGQHLMSCVTGESFSSTKSMRVCIHVCRLAYLTCSKIPRRTPTAPNLCSRLTTQACSIT